MYEYFQSLFHGRLKREFNHVWDELACAVADLPAPELLDDLRQAYEKGLVDPGFARFEGIERDARQTPDQCRERSPRQYELIGDTVSEMEWWAAFDSQETPRRFKRQPKLEPPPALPKPTPDLGEEGPAQAEVRRSTSAWHQPKVGRNDLCPCGSGKKYKKCCMGKR